jgi:phosphoribosylformylglycinamidine synthase
MAASAIDEALRNIVAVGGDPDRTALLDNFCWGNPERPEILDGLTKACQACYDIAKVYGTPFISGKDSLYNEYKSITGETLSIPSTLLISAVSVISDITKTVTMDFKQPDDLIYLVGNTYPEFTSPKVNPVLGKKIFRAVHKAIKTGVVSACHDLSEGGLAIALAEMCFAGNLGAEIYLKRMKPQIFTGFSFNPPNRPNPWLNNVFLFSESNTRFLVSVHPSDKTKFEQAMKNLPCFYIGKTTSSDKMQVLGVSGKTIVNLAVKDMKKRWQTSLGSALK